MFDDVSIGRKMADSDVHLFHDFVPGSPPSVPISPTSLPVSSPSLPVCPPTLLSRVEKYKNDPPPPKKARHVLCEHCNKLLSLKTYRKHYRLFFNVTSGQWISDEVSQRSNVAAEGVFVLILVAS